MTGATATAIGVGVASAVAGTVVSRAIAPKPRSPSPAPSFSQAAAAAPAAIKEDAAPALKKDRDALALQGARRSGVLASRVAPQGTKLGAIGDDEPVKRRKAKLLGQSAA